MRTATTPIIRRTSTKEEISRTRVKEESSATEEVKIDLWLTLQLLIATCIFQISDVSMCWRKVFIRSPNFNVGEGFGFIILNSLFYFSINLDLKYELKVEILRSCSKM